MTPPTTPPTMAATLGPPLPPPLPLPAMLSCTGACAGATACAMFSAGDGTLSPCIDKLRGGIHVLKLGWESAEQSGKGSRFASLDIECKLACLHSSHLCAADSCKGYIVQLKACSLQLSLQC